MEDLASSSYVIGYVHLVLSPSESDDRLCGLSSCLLLDSERSNNPTRGKVGLMSYLINDIEGFQYAFSLVSISKDIGRQPRNHPG